MSLPVLFAPAVMSLSGENMNTSDAPQTDCTYDRCYPLIFLILL